MRYAKYTAGVQNELIYFSLLPPPAKASQTIFSNWNRFPLLSIHLHTFYSSLKAQFNMDLWHQAPWNVPTHGNNPKAGLNSSDSLSLRALCSLIDSGKMLEIDNVLLLSPFG